MPMVGILINLPKNLQQTGLIDDSFFTECFPGEVYQSDSYDLPVLYSFTYDTPYQAAASAQQLVDEGCTLLIYLSGCKVSRKNTPIYCIDFKTRINWNCTEFPLKFIGFIDKSVVKSSISSDPDSELPIDENFIGIANACVVNDIPILALMDRPETVEETDYAMLGGLLRKKLPNILKTDYKNNQDDYPEDVFVPVKAIESIISLVGKKRDDQFEN